MHQVEDYCTYKSGWIAVLRRALEPLDRRQIEALRKASGMNTFSMFLDMNDFVLDLSTKGGRKEEMEKLARLDSGAKRKI